MSDLPFTVDQFYQVFETYNQHVWPTQLLLLAVALVTTGAGLRASPRRTALGLFCLGVLWSWAGVAYHWLHFTAVNPGAWLFGALFAVQAVLLWSTAWRGGAVALEFRRDARGVLGAALIAGALVIYPLIGYALGHAYFSSPTFGAPCPLTIFTFGILLWAQPRAPLRLLVIPLAWALIGSTAIVAFGVFQDAPMPVAALLTIALHVVSGREGAAARAAVAGQ